ncbi:hypothetical protein ACFQZ8_01825 [Micromonospora azadirachtae]|uniref:Uncharacterized protein n=1 Tax=Micromonospora azadirachtae TaxID=1970735 RepID=A0ABW2ZVZ7_9ACTN
MSAARYGRDLLEAVLSRTGQRRGETVATLAMLDTYPAGRLTDTTDQETERDTLIALLEGLGSPEPPREIGELLADRLARKEEHR